MTRREILGSRCRDPALPGRADTPARTRPDPTMDQLINLAEHGADSRHYGRLLAEALAETGRIGTDNGDGTVSLYWAEMIRENTGGNSWAWRKDTVRSAEQPVPAAVLTQFRRENL